MNKEKTPMQQHINWLIEQETKYLKEADKSYRIGQMVRHHEHSGRVLAYRSARKDAESLLTVEKEDRKKLWIDAYEQGRGSIMSFSPVQRKVAEQKYNEKYGE